MVAYKSREHDWNMGCRQGFTLFEIAIVLTIIALIIGGIVLGKSVMTNSQIQSVVADVNNFKNAAKMFQEKYHYLPGDFPGAVNFWSADTTCPTGDTSNYLQRTKTCNGDGDGFIGGAEDGDTNYPSPTNVGTNYREALRLWQHLSNARFINEAYSGIPYAGFYKAGINIPRAKTANSHGFAMFYSYALNSASQTPDGVTHSGGYPGAYKHIIEFGNVTNTSDPQDGLDNPAITAAQAKSLDAKIDDGQPSTGNVRSFTSSSNSSTCSNSSAYLSTGSDIACALIFVTGF